LYAVKASVCNTLQDQVVNLLKTIIVIAVIVVVVVAVILVFAKNRKK